MNSELIISNLDSDAHWAYVAANKEIKQLAAKIESNTIDHKHSAVVVRVIIEKKKNPARRFFGDMVNNLIGFN